MNLASPCWTATAPIESSTYGRGLNLTFMFLHVFERDVDVAARRRVSPTQRIFVSSMPCEGIPETTENLRQVVPALESLFAKGLLSVNSSSKPICSGYVRSEDLLRKM